MSRTPLLVGVHQAAGLEDAQVLRHGGQGHVHRLGQLAERRWAPGQAVHHGAAARGGQRMEKITDRILKHILQYNRDC